MVTSISRPRARPARFAFSAPTGVAYVDLVGSGVETVAHLRENGRIVLMFCAFAGPPKIVRLHGQGRVVPDDDPEFARLLPEFSLDDDARALARGIVVVEATRISDSCGFVVPRMDLVAQRDQLLRWGEQQHAKNGDSWKERYVAANNARSIDGLPGLTRYSARRGRGESLIQQRASACRVARPSSPTATALRVTGPSVRGEGVGCLEQTASPSPSALGQVGPLGGGWGEGLVRRP